jgi:hypothetical protein
MDARSAPGLNDPFDEAIDDALSSLPADLRAAMRNVEIVVEDEPPDGQPLLGLYRGVPLPRRSSTYSAVRPRQDQHLRRPSGDQITLRELAGMRSGLVTYDDVAEFTDSYIADPHQSFSPAQLLGYALDKPLQFAPGTQYHYCTPTSSCLAWWSRSKAVNVCRTTSASTSLRH